MKRVTIKVEIKDDSRPLNNAQVTDAVSRAINNLENYIKDHLPGAYDYATEVEVTFRMEDL